MEQYPENSMIDSGSRSMFDGISTKDIDILPELFKPSSNNSFDSSLSQLPLLELSHSDEKELDSNAIRKIEITGDEGRKSTVHGVEAKPGDTVRDIIKRLHPDLAPLDVDQTVRQMLKYNSDYDNALTDDVLPPGKMVYLTSVVHRDDCGRISGVAKPDGSSASYEYDSNGILLSYELSDENGLVSRAGQRNEAGVWTLSGDNNSTPLDVQVDSDGNLVLKRSEDQYTIYSTSGRTVEATMKDGMPVKVETYLDSHQISRIDYAYENDMVTMRIQYDDSTEPLVIRRFLSERDSSNSESGLSLIPKDESQEELAKSARGTASRMGTTGRCAEGVQLALAEAGLPEFLGSGHAWEMLEPLQNSGKFARVSSREAREGDVMLRRSATGSYGHIAIILRRESNGTLVEASDHISTVDLSNPRYNETVFLRLKGR